MKKAKKRLCIVLTSVIILLFIPVINYGMVHFWQSETSEFTYRGFEVTPDFYVYSPEQDELYRGWDYICEFENNIEPASADDTNPPTVIVRGIGEYTGTLKKTFTITKATPAILRRYADILEGEPLSSIDSTLLARIYGAGNKNISGTIEWEKGNDYVLTGEAGVSESCSMSFIPEDPVHYETVTGIPISISIKKDIQSWNVELEQQNYPYTGVPIEPKVNVKDGDKELRYNYDYYVGYSNNVNCNGETTSPTVIPTTVPTPSSTTAPSTAVPTAVPTDVPTTPQVTVKPSANPSEEDEDDLQVGDKVQDAKKKAYYIVKTVDGDDIEVFYAAPVSKTKAVSITISNTVVLENGQKAKATGIEKISQNKETVTEVRYVRHPVFIYCKEYMSTGCFL